MNFIYEAEDIIYRAAIYDKDGDFIAYMKIKDGLSVAEHSINGRLWGYNLMLYSDGEFTLLETYSTFKKGQKAKTKVIQAINSRQMEIFL